MKHVEGNLSRAQRRDAARAAGNIKDWRHRQRYVITHLVLNEKGEKTPRYQQVVGPYAAEQPQEKGVASESSPA